VENPWVELPNDPPFVLLQDRDTVAQVSKKVATNLSSMPEPFIGDPQTAKVVLLSLNPGDHEEDVDAHRRPDLKEAILPSVVTPKAANEGHLKTGQRKGPGT
jgi:hypothetical protein